MATSEQPQVLAALLDTLKGFAYVARDAVAQGRLRSAGLSPRAEVLYDALLWTSGDAIDFLELLPVCTRMAVEDLLDALLDDGPELDALLATDTARGALALSRICGLIHTVAEVAASEFGQSGVDVQDCDALGATVHAAVQQLGAS